jgi:hypothetical protein
MHPARKTVIKFLFASTASLFFITPSGEISAQYRITSALIKQDTIQTADSVRIGGSGFENAQQQNSKSGNLAMLLSAICPGAGQMYAHRYYTIPLIWGFGYYFGSIALRSNRKYDEYKGKYSESIRLDTLNHTGDIQLKSNRDFYHNQRDEFILYTFLTYILNIIDAYVSATLYDFDVSDNLGGNTEIRFRIPFH